MADYDMYDYMDKEDEGGGTLRRIVIAFILGGLVSSLITMFMTPNFGQAIRRKANRTIREAQDRAGQAKQMVGEAPQRAKRMVNEATSNAKSKVNEAAATAKSAADEASTTAKRRAGKLKDVGERVADETSESIRHGVDDAKDVLKYG